MRKLTSTVAREKQKGVRGNVRPLRYFLNLPYKIELTPLSNTDGGGYFATIPLLRGCQSDGITPDEAIENLREAQKAWIRSALKHGDPIPIPR